MNTVHLCMKPQCWSHKTLIFAGTLGFDFKKSSGLFCAMYPGNGAAVNAQLRCKSWILAGEASWICLVNTVRQSALSNCSLSDSHGLACWILQSIWYRRDFSKSLSIVRRPFPVKRKWQEESDAQNNGSRRSANVKSFLQAWSGESQDLPLMRKMRNGWVRWVFSCREGAEDEVLRGGKAIAVLNSTEFLSQERKGEKKVDHSHGEVHVCLSYQKALDKVPDLCGKGEPIGSTAEALWQWFVSRHNSLLFANSNNKDCASWSLCICCYS